MRAVAVRSVVGVVTAHSRERERESREFSVERIEQCQC